MATKSVNGSHVASNPSFIQNESSVQKKLGQQDFLRLMVVQQMATSLQSNQALQASAFVGRKVLIDNDNLKLDAEGEVKIAVEVPHACNILHASIYTIFGELIKTIVLDQPTPGFFQFNWDGTAEDCNRVKENNYKVEVHAVYENKKLLLKTMTYANVDSVSLDQNGEGLRLNVAGIGAISLDQVRQISV